MNNAKEQIRQLLDRVMARPPDQQADVAEVVAFVEEQDRSVLRLTETQATEVSRRLTEPGE